MVPVLYFPILVASARATISYQVSKHVRHAIPVSVGVARDRLASVLAGAVSEMCLTIILLVTAACWAERIFDRQQTLLLVCSIYAGSILHNCVKLVRYSPLLCKLVSRHRMNIKTFLFEEIYEEALTGARRKLVQMGGVKQFLYRICLGPKPEKIAFRMAQLATPLIWKTVYSRLILLGSAVLLYTVTFRVFLAPLLLHRSLALNPLQAFLWPFAFSLDFFLDTRLQQAVATLG